MRRHGKRKRIYNCVDNNGTFFVRKSFGQTFSHIPGILDTNPFRTHCLGNLRKIWILEIHAKWNKAGFLLLDVDEVELLIVENDLNNGSSPFYLRQQIAQSQHRETFIAG